MKLAFPNANITYKQKVLIQKLCVELALEYPDFDELNRQQAHDLIVEMINEQRRQS